MSYTSNSQLPKTASLSRVEELVELLGYRRVRDDLRIPSMCGSYFWADNEDYKSWTGVELQIYQKDGLISVDTRSRISRSYWDLTHQNRTIKMIRDFIGGYFVTDAGKNRYWTPENPPHPPLASGCYLARWRFHNALMKAHMYLMARRLEGEVSREKSTGLTFVDEMNPRLLSNNLLIPYVIAIWEEYFRSTFAAVLRYAAKREAILKKARLSHAQLEQIAGGKTPIEQAISECFSFQRPSMIADNFKLLDGSLDLVSALRKPYRRRKNTLYESIETLVERRNSFVHTGQMDLGLYDKALGQVLTDVVEAVDRAYALIGFVLGFVPIRDY